eukprot:scaffold20098_cov104-Isochrysis_galbana.AAC.6
MRRVHAPSTTAHSTAQGPSTDRRAVAPILFSSKGGGGGPSSAAAGRPSSLEARVFQCGCRSKGRADHYSRGGPA